MALIDGHKIKLFSLSANPEIAEEIAEFTGIPLSKIETNRFADGEIGVNLPETVRGHHVFLVQPTHEPVNENIMELLITIDAMKRASAKNINVIMPYYGYSRQDRKSKSRQPISAKLVANLIKASKDLNIDSKVGICQSKDSFFGEVEPERMPVAPYLDYKWKAWQKGGVGASEMEAATLFTLAQIKKLKASAVLAVEVSDEETVKKMTQIVLECIHIMEMERLNEK